MIFFKIQKTGHLSDIYSNYKFLFLFGFFIFLFSCQNKKIIPIPPTPPPKKDTVVAVKKSLPVLILDAGHGGIDPGGINDSLHLYEKDVTRKIIDAIAKEVDTNKVKLVLTRVKDEDINRHIRTQKANQYHPNLLLSVHTNYDRDTTVNGVEVSFSDSTFVSITNFDTVNRINPNRDTLWKFSNQLRGKLASAFPTMRSRFVRVRKDHIWMIYEPEYPSILLEFGFITNRKDVTIMTDPLEIKKLAKLMVQSIYRFFRIL